MYYSAGNYEAFARPEKPEGVDRKSAYIIGTGLAGLSAAFYLLAIVNFCWTTTLYVVVRVVYYVQEHKNEHRRN